MSKCKKSKITLAIFGMIFYCALWFVIVFLISWPIFSRAINKPLEDENRRLSSETTRATLHPSHVTQPPHQSLACRLCSQAQLTCVHVLPLRHIEYMLSLLIGWMKFIFSKLFITIFGLG
jgi:hypothetical protein